MTAYKPYTNELADADPTPTIDQRVSESFEAVSKVGENDLIFDEIRHDLTAEPTNFWLWYGFCKCHILNGDISLAVAACEAEIETRQENPAPKLQLQNMLAAKGKYDEAIEFSKTILFDVPASALAKSFFENFQCLSMFTEPHELNMKLFIQTYLF
jgi:hypothetical protein